MNTLKKTTINTDRIRRWTAFFGALFLLFIFIFVVIPMGNSVPLLRVILKHNRESGIHISGLFYSEVDEVAQFTQELLSKPSKTQRPAESMASPEGHSASTQ
ncbi:MAG: hypothetical protein ABIH23_14720 [bacterium]